MSMPLVEQLGLDQLSATEIEEILRYLTQKLYQANRGFTPRYPWVMVRQLSREQRTRGGLVLPELGQNKTIHEGVVIATWKPFTQETGRLTEDGKKLTRIVEKRSQLTIGQHVLYPHWTGMPVRGFPEDQYRIIKEENYEHNGGIYAVVEYSDLESSTREKAKSLLTKAAPADDELITADWPGLITAQLEDQFLLVDRDGHSVTLSGR